jgi:predicted metalloendopeptidase
MDRSVRPGTDFFLFANGSWYAARYRVLTVRNLDPWYGAFDVEPRDALYLPPEKRVRVW